MSLLRQLVAKRFGPTRTSRTFVPDPDARAPNASHDTLQSRSNAEIIEEATAHAAAGRLGQSLALLAGRLVQQPHDRDLIYARALTLFDWNRVREALDGLRAAETHGLSTFGLHMNLAQASHLLGFADDAERHAREAIAIDETHSDAHLCLAAILQTARRFDEAIRSYERTYELAPSRFDCLAQIAACKVDQKDSVAAERVARQAISADGGEQSTSWALLAVALARQDRHDEALTAFDRAEEIDARTGQQGEAFVMHGYNLLECGRVAEAIALYERHLPSKPHPSAHAHYGFSLLTAGRYPEGWNQYEFRWLDARLSAAWPALGQPQWNGQDLGGKTVVLWAEQGFGDSIQFARFAQVMKNKGAYVIFRVVAGLRELAAGFAGVDRVVTEFDEIAEPFDYQIAAMSMPRALGVTVDSIPRTVPYLKVDPERVASWRAKLGSDAKMKVGLVWAGNPNHENDRHRSVPASALAAFWDIPGVQFFSLQKERRGGDEACLPLGTTLIDLSPDLHDFRETAAAVDALNLLIAVDTAVAHVAGALGKPCWLLLPTNADFRWLRDREDSPWYPTIRLFRQHHLGDWAEVIGRVSSSLREAIGAREAGALGEALSPPLSKSSIPPPNAEQETRAASQIGRVADTRYGIVQYSPLQVSIARSLEWYGEWLQPQLDVLARLLRPGAVIVEAASGIGAHAMALARIIGPNGHLLMYEADPVPLRILDQNLQINKLRSLVTIIRRDLAGLTPAARPGIAAGTKADSQDEDNEACDTVDDLGLGRLDLLKINDPEAADTILAGAAETLWRLRPVLFIAASDEAALSRSTGRARDFGYRCWRMETALFNPTNFNRRENDIFAGATALALLAIPEEVEIGVALDACVELR